MSEKTGSEEREDVSRASLLDVLVYGNETLRGRSTAVEEIDDDISRLVDSLFATMYDAPGIGLAAPQVGRLVRLFVVDPARAEEPPQPLAMINPSILEYSGGVEIEEGCLSVPGVWAEVRRPEQILVRYHDVDGKEHEREFDGLMARVIQHENDHLDGRLFIDHLSSMRRTLLSRKLRQIQADSR